MRADFEQLHDDAGYALNAVFNDDDELEPEPQRAPAPRHFRLDEYMAEGPTEPRSHYYRTVDRPRQEYRQSEPQERKLIKGTKHGYTRWPHTAPIEDKPLPDDKDSRNAP